MFTVAVRASYTSNVAAGVRGDAGAITGLSATVERSAGKATNSTRALGLASIAAGKMVLVGVGGALVVSAKAAIDFESSMASVAKTTDLAGTSFQQGSGPLYNFGQALRDLSLRVPVDVNDLAELAAMGGQLGVEVPNLLRFTEVMAALGVSTNLSATEAAQGLARFANIMRTPHDEFDRLGNVIVELGNNLATSESEILRFGTRLAPIGRIVGMTEEEVFALSGALTSLGVPAERGGSALQKWFILAKQAVDRGGESLHKFARVAGMTADEFGELFRRSPAEAIAAFAKGLDTMNASGQNVFATLTDLQLAEVRTTQVLLAMAGGYETVEDAIRMANEEGENGNALFEEAGRRYGTTASQIQLLVNSFEDLKIEIGNALLGSGGLHFAIEALRDFMSIIKDNLPWIGRFVTLLGILGTLRLGAWLATQVTQIGMLATNFKTATGALSGMTGMTKAANVAMLTLGVSMNIALGIAGLVAAAWAWQATKAAELRVKVDQLNQAMDEGKSPAEGLADIFNNIDGQAGPALDKLGFSVQELTEWIVGGKDASGELGQTIERVKDLAASSMFLPDIFAGELGISVDEANALLGAIKELDTVSLGQITARTREFRDLLRGSFGNLSEERIKELSELATTELAPNVSDEGFLQWVTRVEIGAEALKVAFLTSGTAGANMVGGLNALSWEDFVNATDESGEAVGQFLEGAGEQAIEFVALMEEQFAQVGKVVRNGMPVWEEYEKAIFGSGEGQTLGFEKVIAAQESFLQDTEDFVRRMPSIMEMGASADTVAWLDSLDAPIRGAIARLNETQLQELIDGANANFDALNALHLERWMQLYPDNANLAFGAMIGELSSRVGEMNLPGEQSGEAFSAGLMEILANLPEEHQDEFIAYLQELLGNEEWMEANGYTNGDNWILGLLAALRTLSRRANYVIRSQSEQIKMDVNRAWGNQSPSKWWKEQGNLWMEGLKRGIKGQMSDVAGMVTPGGLIPMSNRMGGASGVANTYNNSRTGNYNLTVNSGASGSGIAKEAQTLLTLLTIVGGVEVGAGR